jgi:deazaflavin-dependent oxidoreductase (nitroreductase family)
MTARERFSDRVTQLLGTVAARLSRLRWFVRAPILVYRMHLGFLLGERMLLLEHIGRRSGRRRAVVLEVVDRSNPRRVVVASASGERSQWLRNIRVNPCVAVTIGAQRTESATARVLTRSEARAPIERYAATHPLAWRVLEAMLARASPSAPGRSVDTPLLVELDLDHTAD